MTTPIDPSRIQPPPSPQPPQPTTEPPTSLPTSYVDPSGVWAKFLSTPGHRASAHDVQLFMNGLLKFFNVMIQQQQDAMKQSLEKMKRVAEGNE